MKKWAVYGKGGIGKSTVSANLSVVSALAGRKVIQVGCDPKHDSTLVLTPEGNRPPPIADILLREPGSAITLERVMVRGEAGIDCVEAGGPEPGVGCGGWVIARMFDVFEAGELMDRGYDMMMFDVLGDLVCGGFANPLRQGYAEEVIIVMSEELLAIYAANNISKSVVRYQRNGVRLAGLVVNKRDNNAPLDLVEGFAKQIGAPILAVLPRDPAVLLAERQGRAVCAVSPEAPYALGVKQLADHLWSSSNKGVVPTPMDDETLLQFLRSGG